MKKLFGKLFNSEKHRLSDLSADLKNEDLYYEQLFTKSKDWSSNTPNAHEIERWGHIYSQLNFARGFLSAKGVNDLQILDFGCGRGWLTNLLSDYGKAEGVEPVLKVVEYGRQLYSNIRLNHGSLDFLESKVDCYDLIVSSEVIEHIINDEKEAYFKAFFKALKPQGFLIITTPRAEALKEWMSYQAPGQPIEDWITEEHLQKLANNAGFKEVEVIRYAEAPNSTAPKIEVYQVWLFKKLVV